MKILQINTSVNTGSTGRITEQIGQQAIENGHSSIIAYGKPEGGVSRSKLIKVGKRSDILIHGLKTRLFDLHGFGSKKATSTLVKEIARLNPDVIGLHNLHGYYLNIEVLFTFLKKFQKPVVWTFHDCWPFTGHCTFFDSVGCEKWIDGCFECPKTRMYPASYGLDNSKRNYARKKELFSGLDNLQIVTPSRWLANLAEKSFLHEYPVKVIHNGVDIDVFKPDVSGLPANLTLEGEKIVLGVASTWDRRKGLEDFLKLNKILSNDYRIILVGLNKNQMKDLPTGITGIARTENVQQLAALYGSADVFVNPTWQDNFPTTNIEALACGTPVITYDTGGSPEAVNSETGFVVPKGDIKALKKAVDKIIRKGKVHYTNVCRKRSMKYFNKDDRFLDYLTLYDRVYKN